MALKYVLDTSVWNRLDRAPELAEHVAPLLRRREVGHRDYDLVAAVTEQPTTWALAQGSIS